MRRSTVLALGACLVGLAGCGDIPKPPTMAAQAVYPRRTNTQLALDELPPPTRPVAIAVYGFADQTGQFKPTEAGQTLSRAVSQGGGSMLIRALQDAGRRRWFTIVEREQFKDLLNERQIIQEMRARYLGENRVNPEALPALLFAGVLLEGGVIGFDSNTQTGGAGATLLGIGAQAKYRQDTVTVYLRAVSVKTGEVLTSVTASKTVTSYAVDLNVFRYIASDKLLETENGFTTNEPSQLALQQAIEKAVYGLVMEGADLKLWGFADSATAATAVDMYRAERDGRMSARQVEALAAHRRLERGAQVAAAAPLAPHPSPLVQAKADLPAQQRRYPGGNPASTSPIGEKIR